jgi:hypothetical protein
VEDPQDGEPDGQIEADQDAMVGDWVDDSGRMRARSVSKVRQDSGLRTQRVLRSQVHTR